MKLTYLLLVLMVLLALVESRSFGRSRRRYHRGRSSRRSIRSRGAAKQAIDNAANDGETTSLAEREDDDEDEKEVKKPQCEMPGEFMEIPGERCKFMMCMGLNAQDQPPFKEIRMSCAPGTSVIKGFERSTGNPCDQHSGCGGPQARDNDDDDDNVDDDDRNEIEDEFDEDDDERRFDEDDDSRFEDDDDFREDDSTRDEEDDRAFVEEEEESRTSGAQGPVVPPFMQRNSGTSTADMATLHMSRVPGTYHPVGYIQFRILFNRYMDMLHNHNTYTFPITSTSNTYQVN